jgi:hypothetical protein
MNEDGQLVSSVACALSLDSLYLYLYNQEDNGIVFASRLMCTNFLNSRRTSGGVYVIHREKVHHFV